MKTTQVVISTKQSQAADAPARRRDRLRQLKTLQLEDRDRSGYSRKPQDSAEALLWETVAVWPPQ